MSVQKVNGFAAPYRSATFRAETDAIIGSNGILYIEGAVSESNGDVVIPPFTTVQEGLVIRKNNSTSVPKPIVLEAPYFITVSATTPANTDDLVFQFAKNPSDISPNEVILAEFDGLEWKNAAVISVEGMSRAKAADIVDTFQTGPSNGLQTSIVGSNYKNTPGLLFDKRGEKIPFKSNFLAPSVAADPDTAWRRVDRIIYRRPADARFRIGTRKLVIGGSYAPAGQKTKHETVLSTTSAATSRSRVVISSDNSAHFIYAQGYGTSFSLEYKKYSSDRTSLVTQATVVAVASSDEFDTAIDSANRIHLVYASAGDIRLIILDENGTTLYGPAVIDSLPNPCSSPRVCIDPLSQKLFVTFEYLQGPGNKQIYFATRSLAGALITPPIKITNTTSNIVTPSIDVTDDLSVHLVYEDAGIIKHVVLDDIGQVVQAERIVSAATGSTSYGTLINNASEPIVKVADNKEVYILFKQKRSASLTGLSIYTNGSAFSPDFINSSENFTSYSVYLDSFDNDLHITLAQSGRIDYVLVKNFSVHMSVPLKTTGAYLCYVTKDRLGSLVHTWSDSLSASFSDIDTQKPVKQIGPIAIAGIVNPLVLNPYQFSLQSNIGIVPRIGMKVGVSSSAANNNGSYLVTGVELRSINSNSDTYVITVSTPFANAENGSIGIDAQFSEPDANFTRFVKSVADLDDVRALRTSETASDIVLSRISWPGPMVLNYVPKGGGGINSDMFGMYGDVDVDWAATAANTFTMGFGTRIIDLITSKVYTVAGGSFPMSEGDALYVTLDGHNYNITPAVSPIVSLPWATPIQVLGFVKNNEFNPHLFSTAGMGQLDVGEQIVLGQDLSKALRIRLGITGESTVAPYTSASIVGSTDPYNVAIGKLDQTVAAFGLAAPEEDEFLVTDTNGQKFFTAVTVTPWSINHSHTDIVVYVNGRKQTQDKNGGLARDYRKVGATQIEFAYTVPKNAYVIIRKERTGAPPVSSNVDLSNITVNPQPQSNGAYSLGSSGKAWKSLLMKDSLSNKVYEIKIVNGVLQAEEI